MAPPLKENPKGIRISTDKERHRALKIFAAERGVSMCDLVAAAIDKILSGEIETL